MLDWNARHAQNLSTLAATTRDGHVHALGVTVAVSAGATLICSTRARDAVSAAEESSVF